MRIPSPTRRSRGPRARARPRAGCAGVRAAARRLPLGRRALSGACASEVDFPHALRRADLLAAAAQLLAQLEDVGDGRNDEHRVARIGGAQHELTRADPTRTRARTRARTRRATGTAR